MRPVLKDWYGNPIYPTDKVRCRVGHYESKDRNQIDTVYDTDHTCILLPNKFSKTGYCRYLPNNFLLHEKVNPAHWAKEPKKETDVAQNLMYVAILKEDGVVTPEEVANFLNDVSKGITIMADTSFERLKKKVQESIADNPNEVWVSGTFGNEIRIRAAPITVSDW